MEAERLEQIEQLFQAALEVEKDRGADFLKEACGINDSLRREVESLLAYGSKAETFIETPATEEVARGLAEGLPRIRAIYEAAVDTTAHGASSAP